MNILLIFFEQKHELIKRDNVYICALLFMTVLLE
jgi:hypothetical protein